MIFTAGCDQIAGVISRAASGLPSHPLQDIYGTIHIAAGEDSVRLTAGDGDVTISATVPGVLVSSDGSCVVRRRVLAEMSRYFAGNSVTVEYKDKRLEITAGKSRFTLPAADGDTYPQWAAPPAPAVRLDGEQFTAAIRRVAPAAADGAPPALTAICLDLESGEHLQMVATDAARMAYTEVPVTPAGMLPGKPALLPARAARRIAVTGETGIGWDDSLIGVQADGMRMVSRQVSGKYLPWQKVMAKEPGTITASADAKDLTRALRMAQLAASTTGRVEMTFSSAGLAVSSGDEGQECAEHVDAEYHGEEVTFLFGAQDILDGLAGCGSVAGMAFTQPPAPLFLRDGEFRWMVAPRREL